MGRTHGQTQGHGGKMWPHLFLIASSALWGASSIVIKDLLLTEPITPFVLILGRLLVATVCTWPVLAMSKNIERLCREDVLFLMLFAFVEPFMYSIFETYGLQLVSGSLSSIIVATIPLFVPFGMAACYGEKLNWQLIVSIVISMAGLAIMVLGPHFSLTASPKGLLLMAAAVVVAVVYNLMLVRLLKKYRPFTITAYQNMFAMLYFIPLVAVFDRGTLGELSYSPRMWMLIAFLGILCSTVAHVMYNAGLKVVGATRGSLYNNLIPVFSLVCALAVGQEQFSWRATVGMAVVIVGLVLASVWKHNKRG